MYSFQDDRSVDETAVPPVHGTSECACEHNHRKTPSRIRLDQAAVDRMLLGDDDTWAWFMEQYDSVFRRALLAAQWRISGGGRTIRSLDVAPLVEDAKVYFFLAFLRRFKRYEGEGQFRAFLAGAARNFLLERHRSSPHGESSDDELALDKAAFSKWQTDSSSPHADARAALEVCVESLPRHYRSVLVLYHYSEPARSVSVLAAMMGLSVDAVHKRHQRALVALRRSVTARVRPRSTIG
jgi:RNA polymerase sigma factor (sigma-70 family)